MEADAPAAWRSAKSRAVNRGALPDHLPRIEEVIEPESLTCARGGCLHCIGEDVSERLDIVPAEFRVIVTRRPKYACRCCTDGVMLAPALARLIPGGLPTKATVAHVLVSKYADHLPLYRQAATAEAWIDGHVRAFAFFGGVPQSVLYDEERCLVSKIWPDGTRIRAALFSGLQSHYLFRDRYGRPGKGNDKGAVAGMVGYARRNHMVQIPHFPGWDAFNADLEGQCRARQAARTHDGSFTEVDAGAALQQLDPLWDELFPAEQARIVALLVERVDISTDGG